MFFCDLIIINVPYLYSHTVFAWLSQWQVLWYGSYIYICIVLCFCIIWWQVLVWIWWTHNEWMNEWMNEWLNEWLNEWISNPTSRSSTGVTSVKQCSTLQAMADVATARLSQRSSVVCLKTQQSFLTFCSNQTFSTMCIWARHLSSPSGILNKSSIHHSIQRSSSVLILFSHPPPHLQSSCFLPGLPT